MFSASMAHGGGLALRRFCAAKIRQLARAQAFAQILGKLYFFQLLENLRRILFDYGQKRTGRANAAFNAA